MIKEFENKLVDGKSKIINIFKTSFHTGQFRISERTINTKLNIFAHSQFATKQLIDKIAIKNIKYTNE